MVSELANAYRSPGNAANFSFRVVDENNKPTDISPDGWQVRQKDVWGG